MEVVRVEGVEAVVMWVSRGAQRPEKDVKCPALSLSTLFHETGSLTEGGAILAATSCQQSCFCPS